jgi:hypothetical protein
MQAIDIYSFTDDRRSILSGKIRDIRNIIDILEPSEWVVLDLYINHNVNVYQISILSGRSPKVIGNLIKRLLRQLSKGDYLMLYRHRRRRYSSPKALKVGYDRYLLGMGYRTIAAKRQMSVKEVRQIAKSQDIWLTNQFSETKPKKRRGRHAKKKGECNRPPREDQCQNKE